jgi:hypothetical protein
MWRSLKAEQARRFARPPPAEAAVLSGIPLTCSAPNSRSSPVGVTGPCGAKAERLAFPLADEHSQSLRPRAHLLLRDQDLDIAPVPRLSHRALPPVPDAPLLASA